MQTIRILMLAGMIAIPFQAAEAQLLFGSRLGEAHYQGDDTKIIMGVAADMLSVAPDGELPPLVQSPDRTPRGSHDYAQLPDEEPALPRYQSEWPAG